MDKKTMKTKSWLTAAIAMVCMVVLNSCSYNEMVEKDEAVSTAWSNVETQYQRRADLIPNLVNTVKGYAAHESSTLEAVVEARSKATQITVDPTNLTAEKLAEYQKAQGAVTSALGKLLAVTETIRSSAPTRTSRNCRHSSRALKTASRRPASATTRPCRTTTCSSARSPTTCLPACSASAGKRSSRPRPERKKRQKWNFKLIVIP